MAAKFTNGAGGKYPGVRIVPKTRPGDVKAHSHGREGQPTRGNTMNGMPGYIDGHPEEKLGTELKGGSGSGPKREGDIGKRGASEFKHGKAAKGTMSKSYHAESTARAGPYKSDTDKVPHVHSANVSKGHGGDRKAPPTAHGKIPGGGKNTGAGIGAGRSGHFGTGIGQHGGKMEKLRGHATTSFERGRKRSVMY